MSFYKYEKNNSTMLQIVLISILFYISCINFSIMLLNKANYERKMKKKLNQNDKNSISSNSTL